MGWGNNVTGSVRRTPGPASAAVRKEPGYTYPDYLVHHGVEGMHWGVRRYQNEDGSYTDEGRKHYGIGEKRKKAESRHEARMRRKAEKHGESSTWKSKDAEKLTDDELRRRNQRLQQEQQYKNMTQSKGRKFLKGFGKAMNKILIGSLVGAATGFMAANYKTIVSEGAQFISDWATTGDFMNIRLDQLRS